LFYFIYVSSTIVTENPIVTLRTFIQIIKIKFCFQTDWEKGTGRWKKRWKKDERKFIIRRIPYCTLSYNFKLNDEIFWNLYLRQYWTVINLFIGILRYAFFARYWTYNPNLNCASNLFQNESMGIKNNNKRRQQKFHDVLSRKKFWL